MTSRFFSVLMLSPPIKLMITLFSFPTLSSLHFQFVPDFGLIPRHTTRRCPRQGSYTTYSIGHLPMSSQISCSPIQELRSILSFAVWALRR
ncbi:hypothetical protein GQ44DRAFT_700002 [Phaeosphaeriaceae sp. PMI808]|nr:hypothetical protein GQ44DRAFT_700002 [Phaeosphaeriaceae sp. PMI808]